MKRSRFGHWRWLLGFLTAQRSRTSVAAVKALRLHPWKVTPRQGAQIQTQLRRRLELVDRLPRIRRVAGADVALATESHRAIAGVVVYRYPEMEEIERQWATAPLTFPYIPGLLSFREIPVLLRAFARLRSSPDLIFCDGHGYAHPRRFGIACHLGVLLNRPSIGCAKSLLLGTHADPPQHTGAWVPLRDGDEILGAVLRTRENVKPIYVTQGHRISLPTAVALVLSVSDGFRIPRPTRDADHFVGQLKRRGTSQVQ